MPDTPNLAVVRKFYDSLRAPATIAPLLSPSIRYEITPGFPHSGIFIGLDAIVGDFFTPLMEDFVDWRTEPSEFHESGDRVFTIGLYSARAKATGKPFTACFSHLWTLDAGVITRLQHCADTLPIARALLR